MKLDVRINSKFQSINASFNYNENTKVEKAVLMLHGFATDRHEAGGLYDIIADSLLKIGIASLQIDFGGWGANSSEQLNDFSIKSMVHNTVDSISFLKDLPFVSKNVKLIVIGCSLGSSIAIISQYLYKNFVGMVLISPACNLRKDFTAFLGEFGEKIFSKIDANQFKPKEKVEIPLNWRTHPLLPISFFLDLTEYNVEAMASNIECPILAIAGDEDFSKQHALNLKISTKSNNCQYLIIEKADHIFYMFTPNKSKIDIVINNTTLWISTQFVAFEKDK